MKTETIKHLNSRLTNLAFTLAETLIVIGIIGVVAALTLPNLNHATGDKERVTRVKKIYSSLTEAFDRAEAIYGPIDEWRSDANNRVTAITFGKRISEFMKISKDCGSLAGQGCFASGKFKYLNGNEYGVSLDTLNSGTAYRFITSDGTSILINQPPVDILNIYVDIDGPNKGANKYGNDIFRFNVRYGSTLTASSYSQIEPDGYNNTATQMLINFRNTGNSGEPTAAWVLEYDNADYLKCLDSLSETKTSCN